MTDRKRHFVGQLQAPGKRPENVELIVSETNPAYLVTTFTDGDTTPSVRTNEQGKTYKTANTSGTTISDFDDGFIGQKINVVFNDANTTVDFTASGLKGNGGSDWSPTTGDMMVCVYDGTDWYCNHIGVVTGVLADQAATATNPIDVSSQVISMDAEALTTIEGSDLAATDTFYVEDGGVSKGIEVQALGLRVQTAQTTQTLAASDMNSIMEFTGTATLTLPLNSTVDLPIGVPVILNVKHATQVLTVTAATSVTLVSVYHPGGASAASDTVDAGGTAILYKTATNVWALSGDISN